VAAWRPGSAGADLRGGDDAMTHPPGNSQRKTPAALAWGAPLELKRWVTPKWFPTIRHQELPPPQRQAVRLMLVAQLLLAPWSSMTRVTQLPQPA